MTGTDAVSAFTQVIDLDDHDNSEIKRSILNRTEKDYDRTLKIFDQFLRLHPKASPLPNIQSFKGFMEFVARNIKGRIRERPTVRTIDGFRRDFQAALALRRDRVIPENVSTTIREWIKKDLQRKIPLCRDEMDKEALSPNDLTVLKTQLWCRDFKEYRGKYPDRTRVQLSAAMLLYCFTSAQAGEVHESTAHRALARKQKDTDEAKAAEVMAACYRHFILTIEWVDGVRMLVLTYSRRYVKGYWRKTKWELPIHSFYEIYKEKCPLYFNLLIFFLPLASADQAFLDYESINEILDSIELTPCMGPEEKEIVTISFKEEVLDVPIFRPYNEQAIMDSTGRARGADAFGKEFTELGRRSGYKKNITARACRRWALMEADKKYSETAWMKYAGQVHRDTYGKSYAHPLSEVDGPVTYLGITPRHGHIQNRHSMAIHHNPHLWQSLPAKAEFEFQERTDVMALDKEMQSLSMRLSLAQSPDDKYQIQLEQHRVYNRKQKLYLEELRHLQQIQPKSAAAKSGSIHEQTLFHYIRRVIPERDLLARILPMSVDLRSAEGREALRALEAICLREGAVAYRSGMSPLEGKCICGDPIEKFFPHRQWLHLHRCYREQLQKTTGHEFVEFCFECDHWFQGLGEWTDHCQEHLATPEGLVRCDLIIFRNAPVKAAFCPFCLGDTSLKPHRRMQQYLDRSKWHEHVQSHLNYKALSGKFHCRHPACSLDLDSMAKLEYHLRDVHCYSLPRGKKRALDQLT